MKRPIYLLGFVILALLIANVTWAQSISIGLRGGVNLARWQWEDDANVDKDMIKNLPGVYVAMPVEIGITDYFAVQPELVFVQKGIRLYADETSGGYETEVDARTTLNYVGLPVLAKARFGNEQYRFFAIAGPEVAYALNGKSKVEMTISNGETYTDTEEEDIDFEEDGISRFDVGLLFGVGADLKLGPGAVMLDARYNLGLMNLNTNTDDNVDVDNYAVYNRGILLSVGYRIPIR